MKSKLLVVLVLSIFVILVAACGGAATPAKVTKIRVAFGSAPGFDHVARLVAFEELADKGYAVTPVFYAQNELAAAAVARGDAEIGTGSSATYLRAVQKGANIKWISSPVGNSQVLMAKQEIKKCADLADKKVAIGSEGAVGAAMLRAWMLTACPGTKPSYLIMPGSDSRGAAMLTGQIDATTLEVPDVVKIKAKAGDKFWILSDFGRDLPNLLSGGEWVRTDWLEQNPKAARDYVAAVLQVNRRAMADPKWYVQQAIARVPGLDVATLDATMQTEVDIKMYTVNGGITKSGVEYSVKFFVDSQQIDAEPKIDTDKIMDMRILEDVLKEIGKK